jgi:hypothetical protein
MAAKKRRFDALRLLKALSLSKGKRHKRRRGIWIFRGFDLSEPLCG